MEVDSTESTGRFPQFSVVSPWTIGCLDISIPMVGLQASLQAAAKRDLWHAWTLPPCLWKSRGPLKTLRAFFFLQQRHRVPQERTLFPILSYGLGRTCLWKPARWSPRAQSPLPAPASTAAWHSAPKQRGRVATLSRTEQHLVWSCCSSNMPSPGTRTHAMETPRLGAVTKIPAMCNTRQISLPVLTEVTVCSSRQPDSQKTPKTLLLLCKTTPYFHLEFLLRLASQMKAIPVSWFGNKTWAVIPIQILFASLRKLQQQ